MTADTATPFPPFDLPFELPAALVVIDMQPCGVDPSAGLTKAIEDAFPGYTNYLVDRVERTVTPALQQLHVAFQRAGQPTYFTKFGSATGDGSDIITATIRHRDGQRRAQSGTGVVLPQSSPDAAVIDAFEIGSEDEVFGKVTMDTFASTPIAERLAARGVRTVVVAGVLTDACVEGTARSAAEQGYAVFIPEDGCASWTEDFHEASLANLARFFARITTSAELVDELGRHG